MHIKLRDNGLLLTNYTMSNDDNEYRTIMTITYFNYFFILFDPDKCVTLLCNRCGRPVICGSFARKYSRTERPIHLVRQTNCRLGQWAVTLELYINTLRVFTEFMFRTFFFCFLLIIN